MRATTPTANYRNMRNRVPKNEERVAYHNASDRPPTMAASRFGPNPRNQGSSYDCQDFDCEFKPATTVHDVVVIPGYFSSGEEDQAAQHSTFAK